MKKLLIIGLCLFLLISMFTACSSRDVSQKAEDESQNISKEENKGSEVTETQETVTITWFTEAQDDEAQAETRKYIIEPFEKKFPNIKIKHLPTADWNRVLKVQMAAGKGPDMFNLDGPTVAAEYVSADRMLDLTPYVEKYGWDEIIFQWALDSCKVDGKVYSIPNSYEALVLWYNEDMFEENNWEVPKNFDDLKKIAKAAMDKGLMPFAFGSSDFKPANEWWISVVLANYAGRDAVKKALMGEIKWTDEPIKGAISLLVKMWQDGWINDRNSHAISLDDASALFAQKRAPMKMEGTWHYGWLAGEDLDFKWNIALFPSLKEGTPQTLPLALGGVWGVNANTKYADQVAQFINFMYQEVELHARAIEEAGFQPLPRDIPSDLFTDAMEPVNKKMLNMLVEAQKSDNIGYCMWTFWPPETRNYMIDNIEKVFLNQMSVEDYLKGVQEIFDKEKAAGKVPIIP